MLYSKSGRLFTFFHTHYTAWNWQWSLLSLNIPFRRINSRFLCSGRGDGWADPKPYIAATAPEFFRNDQYKEEALHLAWREFLRRSKFHTIRILISPFYNIFQMESGLAYWSLTTPDVLPVNRQEVAFLFAQRLSPNSYTLRT